MAFIPLTPAGVYYTINTIDLCANRAGLPLCAKFDILGAPGKASSDKPEQQDIRGACHFWHQARPFVPGAGALPGKNTDRSKRCLN
jgi:hypothetical protein